MVPYHWQYLPLFIQILAAFGLGAGMVLASWFAIFARPLMNRFSRVTHGRHRAAALLTVLLLLLVLVPIGVFAVSLVSAAMDLIDTVIKSRGGKQALEAIVSGSG